MVRKREAEEAELRMSRERLEQRKIEAEIRRQELEIQILERQEAEIRRKAESEQIDAQLYFDLNNGV